MMKSKKLKINQRMKERDMMNYSKKVPNLLKEFFKKHWKT